MIIFIIPFYTINAAVSSVVVNFKRISEVFAIVRATYEAILIMSFFQLVVAYVCYKKEVNLHKHPNLAQKTQEFSQNRRFWQILVLAKIG